MADKTPIEWTDKTWHCVRGCSKKSPGCRACWAIKDAHRMARNPNPKIAAHFEGLTVLQFGSKPNWSGIVRLDEAILDQPSRWRQPSNIFVAASGDLFHEKLSDEQIDLVFGAMHRALGRGHVFQILTKEPERARAYLMRSNPTIEALRQSGRVWIGTSVEDQKRADERIAPMAWINAAGWPTWVSNEPALGPIDWDHWEFIRWMVSGGESDKEARRSHPDWFRDTRDWCVKNGIPFLFKQWGNWAPFSRPDGIHQLPFGGYNVETGFGFIRRSKKKSGRRLDGVTWSQFPQGMHDPAAKGATA
jgi:protein gp37